jgi:hypothetical protein
MQTIAALATLRNVLRSPVARIALTWASPQAARKSRTLVVKRLPVLGQHMLAGDDDVDLARAVGDRSLDLAQLHIMRHESRRKAGRDRSDRNVGSIEGFDRSGDEAMIDADRTGGDVAIGKPSASRMSARIGAFALAQRRSTRSAVSSPLSVVRSMQVIGLEQPGRLRVLLHRTAARQSGDAPLGGRKIQPDIVDQIARASFMPSLRGKALWAGFRQWQDRYRHHHSLTGLMVVCSDVRCN